MCIDLIADPCNNYQNLGDTNRKAITLHRNLIQCFVTTYSLRGDTVLWERQEQASCFGAVCLLSWNIRKEIYVSNIQFVKHEKEENLFYSL